jgi:MFS family permease
MPLLIVLLCLFVFTSTFAIGAFPALLPELGTVAGLSDVELGAVAGIFAFARMSADIPIGLFVTHHVRAALVLAPVGVVAGILCLGTGGPLPVLLLGRALMGVGHALGMVGGITALLRHGGARTLGAALNAFEFSAMLGILGGIALLGALPTRLPWNVALLGACVPHLLGVLVLPFLLRALPRRAAGPRPPLLARRATAGTGTPLTPSVWIAFAVGAAIAVAYSAVEQFIIPLRGSREFGLDRAGVARVLSVMQLCDLVALLPVGYLADRRGTPRVLGVIVLLMAVAAALIAFGDLPLLVAGTACFGVAMAGWMLPLGLLRRDTPPEEVAWRTALYRVAADAGLFLGPFLSGLLAGHQLGLLPAIVTSVLVVLGVRLLRHRPAPVADTAEAG